MLNCDRLLMKRPEEGDILHTLEQLLVASCSLATSQVPLLLASLWTPSLRSREQAPSAEMVRERGSLSVHSKNFGTKACSPWLRVKSGCKCKENQLDFID
jgi:hypothetical protein